ncbi:MAG TPA: nuclear transport factor 2 family protein [Solirubrobacteraceae bacterium]
MAAKASWRPTSNSLEALEDFRLIVDEIFAHGDQVITDHWTVARGGSSGATLEQRGAAVWTLRNGLIVRVQWFGTRREALEAAGLEE